MAVIRSILLSICTGIVVLLLPEWAAANGEKSIRLENIVVTATKTQKDISDAPGDMSVVTQQDIDLQNVRTVDEALKALKGLFAKRNKGLMDSTGSVRMRGFSGDQYTLVLIDGQPLNDGYTGGLEWGSLPVQNIERIEVMRGAASALYGGNAMGGVINIITKTPDKPDYSVAAGYGTHDTTRFQVSAGDRFGEKLSLRLGYEIEKTAGYETTPVVRSITSGAGAVSGGYAMNDKYGNPASWVVGDKGKNNAKKWSLDGKATLDYSDTGKLSFGFISGFHSYDYDPPNTYMGTYSGSAIAGDGLRASFSPNNFIDYTGIGKNETDMYNLGFEELLGTIRLHAQVGFIKTDDRYTTESGSSAATYDTSPGSLKITETESWYSEICGDIPLGKSHLLTAGVSCRTDKSDTDDYKVPYYRDYDGRGTSTFYSGGKDRSFAVFLQDEWNIVDPFTLYLGLRYDWWKVYDGASGDPASKTSYESNTDSQLSPKAAVVWRLLPDTALRASVGHAFRPPTLYELYRTWESWGTTYQSNPQLDPETVWTYEAGLDQYFLGRRTRFSLTVYRNDIKDLIYYKIDSVAKTKKRMNAGEARTYGLELELSHQLAKWLRVWGNLTYTDAQIIDNSLDPASEDKYITGIPKNTYNFGAELEYAWLKGSLSSRYFSKIYNDSDNGDTENGVYGTYEPAFYVDAKIIISPCKWADIALSVDNIFDKDYYEYYEQDGRTFFCELTLRY